jgi:hypothetical protein
METVSATRVLYPLNTFLQLVFLIKHIVVELRRSHICKTSLLLGVNSSCEVATLVTPLEEIQKPKLVSISL